MNFNTTFNTKIKSDAVILAIESSCDETACAIIKGGRQILSSVINSSSTEHVKYGGVVPEIASRAHVEVISKTVEQAVLDAGLTLSDIDAVAVTYGAGLIGALLVGVSYAKSLAQALNIPLIAVNHIRGHLSASYLVDKDLKPPFISILASGGHTAIIKVNDYLDFQVLGSTKDDAVGEAFDKVARVLGLSYPGGPNVEKLALQGADVVPLPKMFKGQSNYDFSYSGLKTAIINYVNSKKMKGEPINSADIANSFQHSAIDVLIEKGIHACKESGLKVLTVGGGVSANGYFRQALLSECEKRKIKCVLPPKVLCTDNACMIGAEGYIQYINGKFASLDLNAKASIEL